MNFVESIAVELAAAAVIAVVVALWKTRHRITMWAQRTWASLQQRREPKKLSREELIARVLRRADVLGVDVPVKRQRRGDVVTITFHPSGRTHDVFTGDLASYKAASLAGTFDPRRSGSPNGRPPLIVSKWSNEKLHTWLAEHTHRTPSAQ